jgi:ABC-type transport system involved in multi-copper enzyme maturation permease subunit
MVELFRAEWMKINGNRFMTSFTVWLFPVGVATFLTLALIPALASELFRSQVNAAPPTWTMQTLLPWTVINSIVTRLILVAFAADVFAGEYQRSMWKNLLPRRRRMTYILMKFFTMSLMLMIAFLLTCVLAGLISGLVVRITGAPYNLTQPGETLSDFFNSFGLQAFVAIISALIAACFGALGGIVTRSIIGAVGFGAICTVGEQAMLMILFLVGNALNAPSLIGLYQYTPGYNLSNISSWATAGAAYTMPGIPAQYIGATSAGTSFVILLAWVVGLIGLTVWLFRRQDILS